jgi:hypothetical protein
MTEERHVFVYRGVVTSENSVSLLTLLEKELEKSEFGFLGRKRLFMFVLESLQNISRHASMKRYADMSLVVFSRLSEGYTVTTANIIPDPQVYDLRKRLIEINHLDADEVRNVYRQMLKNAEFSVKGGAGLGLIEMAKKTGNKLDFDFLKFDDDYSYFILSKTVTSEGSDKRKRQDEKRYTGNSIAELERLMALNNIYMIWSGHVSHDVGKEVLSFTEKKLTEDDVRVVLRKKVYSILVEILENLANYSPGIEPEKEFGMPVAILKMENKTFYLSTGNLILRDKVPELKEKLDTVNRYDKMGIKELFRESLSGQKYDSDSTGNLGLIDMARKSGNKLKYEFQAINEMYSYYTLTVKVEENFG